MRKKQDELITFDGKYPEWGSSERNNAKRRRGEDVVCKDMETRYSLNPLLRYIEANVGRKWADVYREICEKNSRQYARYLIEQHIGYWVADKGKGESNQSRWRYHSYYVDQNDILRKVPEKPRYKRSKPERPALVTLNGTTFFKHKKIWYRIQFQDLTKILPENVEKNPYKDCVMVPPDVFGIGSYRLETIQKIKNRAVSFYGRAIYVNHKEQANKNEIRRIEKYRQKSMGN